MKMFVVSAIVMGTIGVAVEVYHRWFMWRHKRRMSALRAAPPSNRQRQDDARLDAHVEMCERAVLPCVMCDEIGDPHVCEREWWRQRLAHKQGNVCADPDCVCHVSAALGREADALWPRGAAS